VILLIMKKLVFTHGGGRLANQLTNFAHLISFIEENKGEFELENLAFLPYSQLFEGSAKQHFCIYPPSPSKVAEFGTYFHLLSKQKTVFQNFTNTQLLRYLHLKAHWSKGWQSLILRQAKYDVRSKLAGKYLQLFDMESADFKEIMKQKNTLMAGWAFRCWNYVEKHQHVVRNYLKINPVYLDNAQKQLQAIRAKHPFVVGILIRQTDYRIWNGGKFYFDSPKYAQWLLQLHKLFAERNVAFVLTSDEKQDENLFQAANVYWASGTKHKEGHFMESFSALSMCNLIVSAPSTFSLWAAFLGDVAMLPLCTAEQQLSENQIINHHIFDAIHHHELKQAIK